MRQRQPCNTSKLLLGSRAPSWQGVPCGDVQRLKTTLSRGPCGCVTGSDELKERGVGASGLDVQGMDQLKIRRARPCVRCALRLTVGGSCKLVQNTSEFLVWQGLSYSGVMKSA